MIFQQCLLVYVSFAGLGRRLETARLDYDTGVSLFLPAYLLN